jgi:hypothetical protein
MIGSRPLEFPRGLSRRIALAVASYANEPNVCLTQLLVRPSFWRAFRPICCHSARAGRLFGLTRVPSF